MPDYHSQLTGATAIHPISYRQSADPGAVGARKLWLDTTNGTTLFDGGVLKIRNEADSGWDTYAIKIDATAPSDGDVLTWNNATGYWEAAAPTGGGGGGPPDEPPASPHAEDDEFTSDTGPDGTADWAWANQGGASYAISSGRLRLTAPAGSGNNFRMLVRSIPGSGSWRYEAKARLIGRFGVAVTTGGVGLMLRESATGKLRGGFAYFDANLFRVFFGRYTNETTYSGEDYTYPGVGQIAHYFAIESDGTDLSFEWSPNGLDWAIITTAALNNHFTTAPDQIALVANADNASRDIIGAFEWFRRTI
jgi:hypothetical protein